MPLETTATLSLVYHVWTTVYVSKVDPTVLAPWHRLRLMLLLAGPWIVFGTFGAAGAWIGYQEPFRISRHRRFFYCSLDFDPFSKAISIFCTLTLTITLGFGVSIGRVIWKNWRVVRKGLSDGNVDMSLLLRVAGFVFYVGIGLIMASISIVAPSTPIPDLYLASVGFVLALIFGTQRNVFTSLALWIRTVFGTIGTWLKNTPQLTRNMMDSMKFWRNRGIKGDGSFGFWRKKEAYVDLA